MSLSSNSDRTTTTINAPTIKHARFRAVYQSCALLFSIWKLLNYEFEFPSPVMGNFCRLQILSNRPEFGRCHVPYRSMQQSSRLSEVSSKSIVTTFAISFDEFLCWRIIRLWVFSHLAHSATLSRYFFREVLHIVRVVLHPNFCFSVQFTKTAIRICL